MTPFEIRAIEPQDRAAVDAMTERHWGGTRVVYAEAEIETSGLPGALGLAGGAIVAAVTWRTEGPALHIVTLVSEHEGRGIGGALMRAAEAEAVRLGLHRLVVSTTNDITAALRFYQRDGYRLETLHRDIVARLRASKPSIPLTGYDGIAIRDQIDLAKDLG